MKTPDRGWYTIASIACIAFLVGGATSAAIFWSVFESSETSSNPLDPTLDEALRAEASSDTDPSPQSNYEGTSDFAANSGSVASLEHFENDFDRTLKLYQLVSESNTDQLVAMIRESKHFESDTKRDIQEAIFQRLALLDPKLAFTHAEDLNISLIDIVFTRVRDMLSGHLAI